MRLVRLESSTSGWVVSADSSVRNPNKSSGHQPVQSRTSLDRLRHCAQDASGLQIDADLNPNVVDPDTFVRGRQRPPRPGGRDTGRFASTRRAPVSGGNRPRG